MLTLYNPRHFLSTEKQKEASGTRRLLFAYDITAFLLKDCFFGRLSSLWGLAKFL